MYVSRKREIKMVTDINPLDNIVTLLSSNYDTQDNIFPVIAKIYTKPLDKEPRPNEDFIYVYSELTSHNSSSMGTPHRSEVVETVKIDIRVKPSNTTQSGKVDDTHARKVLTEVKRILYENVVDPDSDFNVIDPQISQVDLSNGVRGIFRYVLTINLISYCRDMTA